MMSLVVINSVQLNITVANDPYALYFNSKPTDFQPIWKSRRIDQCNQNISTNEIKPFCNNSGNQITEFGRHKT